MKPPLKRVFVAGYVRVSSEPQANDEKSSLEIQREAVQKYANEHGWKIFAFYEDHESGKKVDRTNYSRMKMDAQGGHFSKVLFFKWDRFARNAKEVLTTHDELKGIGVDIVCVSQGCDTSTAHGRFFMTQLAAFAEMEWAQIRERTLSGLKARADQNMKIGSPPFGYLWDEEAKRFKINEKEAEVYRLMVSLYLEKGLSQTQIASHLNQRGFLRSQKARKVVQSSVGVILKNPAYLGKYRYRFQSEDYEIDIPPLIDRRKWEAIQRKSRENFSRSTRSRNFSPNDPFVLRDVLKCGECGYGIMALIKKHKRVHKISRNRYYACYLSQARKAVREALNPREGKRQTCHLPYIPAELLEREVKGLILSHFQFPQNLIRRWKEQTSVLDKGDIEFRLKGAQIKLGKLQTKRDEYWSLFNESEIDRDELKKQEGILRGQIESLKAEIGENEKKLGQIKSREIDLKNLTEAAQGIKAIFPEISKAIAKLTDQQWKELIRTGLEGERLTISIARRADVVDSAKGLTAKQLNEPLYRRVQNQQVVDWKVEGDWHLNLDAIAQYLKPLVNLNNRRRSAASAKANPARKPPAKDNGPGSCHPPPSGPGGTNPRGECPFPGLRPATPGPPRSARRR
jgi:DNA invertase Pin-like site-specific DNA recombinase